MPEGDVLRRTATLLDRALAGPAQLRADEDVAGQRAVEQGGRPPQHVTLGHRDARRS